MDLNPADEDFARLLPPGILRPVAPRYLQEPRGKWAGLAGILALPRDTQEVSDVVKIAAAAKVPVVPYGGGTGLVGGQVKPNGPAPLILSLEKMNAIRNIHPEENVLVAESGAILADVQQAALDKGRLFPLSLASEGSAQIGGNLSTNAGGVNVLRYGNARDLCLGLEVVLPDGRIWNGLTRLRKDNTGYDLRNLLIGAEGTLGVITAAALKLSPIPSEVATAIFIVPSPRAALDLLALAREQMGDTVSAFELIHRQGLDFQTEVMPAIRHPFGTPPEWSVLVEVGLAKGQNPRSALEIVFEQAVEKDLASDGVIASSEAQRQELWTIREHLPEANRLIGAISSHDISLPLGTVDLFITKATKLVDTLGTYRVNCFGHLGDGNLHFNVFAPKGRSKKDYRDQARTISNAIHDLVHEMDGSFSAEHGVGRMKAGDLAKYADPVKLAAMKAIKSALDPSGIMNPGVIFV